MAEPGRAGIGARPGKCRGCSAEKAFRAGGSPRHFSGTIASRASGARKLCPRRPSPAFAFKHRNANGVLHTGHGTTPISSCIPNCPFRKGFLSMIPARVAASERSGAAAAARRRRGGEECAVAEKKSPVPQGRTAVAVIGFPLNGADKVMGGEIEVYVTLLLVAPCLWRLILEEEDDCGYVSPQGLPGQCCFDIRDDGSVASF